MKHIRLSRAVTLTAISAFTIAALVGCGRSDGSTDVDTGDAISDGPATGTITVWAMGDEGDKLDQVLADFQAANPDATVEVTAVPWGNAYEKISAAVAAQTLPDVLQVGTTWMGEWGSAGAFDPTPEGFISADDFFEGPWGTTIVDGTQYGIPWGTDPRALIYRKDLAEQAGVEAPTTWDELSEFAAEIQSGGYAPYGVYVPVSGVGLWANMIPFAYQAGGDIVSEDGSSFTFDDESWEEGLSYYASLVESGVAPDRQIADGPDVVNAFVTGEIASFVGSSYHVKASLDQGGEAFTDKLGLVVMPARDAQSEPSSLVGGTDFIVSSNSQNRDSAWKLVKYLGSAEVQIAWFQLNGSSPASVGAWDDSALADDPVASLFAEALISSKAVPSVPTWTQIAAVIDTEVEKVVAGTSTPAEALERLQNEADQIGTGR